MGKNEFSLQNDVTPSPPPPFPLKSNRTQFSRWGSIDCEDTPLFNITKFYRGGRGVIVASTMVAVIKRASALRGSSCCPKGDYCSRAKNATCQKMTRTKILLMPLDNKIRTKNIPFLPNKSKPDYEKNAKRQSAIHQNTRVTKTPFAKIRYFQICPDHPSAR